MKKVIGFALFWVAVGLILSMILPNAFIEVICIILCILAGYNLFLLLAGGADRRERFCRLENIFSS